MAGFSRKETCARAVSGCVFIVAEYTSWQGR